MTLCRALEVAAFKKRGKGDFGPVQPMQATLDNFDGRARSWSQCLDRIFFFFYNSDSRVASSRRLDLVRSREPSFASYMLPLLITKIPEKVRQRFYSSSRLLLLLRRRHLPLLKIQQMKSIGTVRISTKQICTLTEIYIHLHRR